MFFKFIDVFSKHPMNPSHLPNINTVIGEKYDLFFANNQTQAKPIIVNIHGGGFLAGDKKYRRYWCETLAADGWFVINANYRLCPDVTIIDQIKDVWAIMHEISALSQHYHLDSQTVVVTGDSAGAFFAAYMVALTTNESLRQRFQMTANLPFKISGALLFCGVYDFTALIKSRKSPLYKEIASSALGSKIQKLSDVEKYEFYHELSIPSYINKDWCPVAIFYSKKDIFLKGQGEIMFAKLQEQGVPCRQSFSKSIWHNHGYPFFFRTKISQKSIKIAREFLSGIKTKPKTHPNS